MSETFKAIGKLSGHRNWVTSIACPENKNSFSLFTASRDKTIVAWKSVDECEEDKPHSVPFRRLEGHSDFVEEFVVSNNVEFIVSASWDKTLKLWSLRNGQCITTFRGHKSDVVSVDFSPDNRQIVSASRDGTIIVWNVKGEIIYTFDRKGHDGWVNCIRYSPNKTAKKCISGGADGAVKAWSCQDFTLSSTLTTHDSPVLAVAFSPCGSLGASASKNGVIHVLDITKEEFMYKFDCPAAINALVFSPSDYLLASAAADGVHIWDLEKQTELAHLVPESTFKTPPQAISVAWSPDGKRIFAGFTDNTVQEWGNYTAEQA